MKTYIGLFLTAFALSTSISAQEPWFGEFNTVAEYDEAIQNEQQLYNDLDLEVIQWDAERTPHANSLVTTEAAKIAFETQNSHAIEAYQASSWAKAGAEWEIEQLDERQILSEIDSSISPPTPQEYATQQTIVDNAEAVMCYWQPEWDQWQPIHSAWLDDWLYVTMYTEQIDSHVEQMQEAQGRIDMLEAEKLELIDWLNNN